MTVLLVASKYEYTSTGVGFVVGYLLHMGLSPNQPAYH